MLAQTHVHQVSDVIQPSYPLPSPSPPAFNLAQHRGLLQWVSSLHQVAKVLELQHHSFQWIFRTDFFSDFLVGSPCKSKGLSRVFSNTKVQKHQFFSAQLSLQSICYIHTWLLALTRWTFVGKIMSLLFNMLSRLVVAFLPSIFFFQHLFISWLQSPSAVILESKKIKSVTVSIVSPSICHEVMGPDAMILVFWMLSLKPTFSLFSYTFIKRLFSSFLLSAIRVVASAFWGYWYFSGPSLFQLELHPGKHITWCTLHVN